MAKRIEFPVPDPDCRDCSTVLHERLMAVRDVQHVTIDNAERLVHVDIADEHAPGVPALLDELLRSSSPHARHAVAPRPLPALPQAWPASPTPPGAGTNAMVNPAAGRASGASHGHHDHDHDHGDHDHGAHGAHEGHSHEHGHDHSHDYRDQARRRSKRLMAVFVMGAMVIAMELAAALASNSLSLMADAAHATTDLAAVGLALLAAQWVVKKATNAKTWGYHRAEIIAAFVNAVLLWGVSVYFIFEAYQRFRESPIIEGPIVIIAGGLTLAANLIFAKLLHEPHGGNINMRAAYLHVLSDAMGSLAALVAGLLVYRYQWYWADPLLTLFITGLILIFTWRLTKQTLHILMEGAPAHANPNIVASAIRDIPGVKDVHDLHVWTITSGVDSVSAHVVLAQRPQDDRIVHEVQDRLRQRFRIDHVTIQVEDPSCPCSSVPH